MTFFLYNGALNTFSFELLVRSFYDTRCDSIAQDFGSLECTVKTHLRLVPVRNQDVASGTQDIKPSSGTDEPL
ncbi:hypothetical protein BDR05DRAFT_959604 [Suillus weaverae]|nr:hypothetical protein BDR05DRAFT_959604 [Suillus weaverae]